MIGAPCSSYANARINSPTKSNAMATQYSTPSNVVATPLAALADEQTFGYGASGRRRTPLFWNYRNGLYFYQCARSDQSSDANSGSGRVGRTAEDLASDHCGFFVVF